MREKLVESIKTDYSRMSANKMIAFENAWEQFSLIGGISRTAAEEVIPTGSLTFSESSSLKKIELHHIGRTPPIHPWYFGKNPGGSFKLMPRKYQNVFSCFVSGHINALTFRQGQKIFPECHLCYFEMVSPAHILTCLDFKKDEVLLDSTVFRIS
ncbi:hypothetical protein TNCV_3360161 [Trichonephila clavipes]|nr:hypothetical protein TNCV_3360161 [Trichonephila clavipes]